MSVTFKTAAGFVCTPAFPLAGKVNPLTRFFHFVMQSYSSLIHRTPLKTTFTIVSLLKLTQQLCHYSKHIRRYSPIIYFLGISTLLKIAKEWAHLPIFGLQSFGNNLGYPIKLCTGMKSEMYKRRRLTLDDKLIAEMSYMNQHGRCIPVFETFTYDPFLRGQAQGYLLGEQIIDAYFHGVQPMEVMLRVQGGDVSGDTLDHCMKHYRFPEDIQAEFAGLVEGLDRNCKERGTTNLIDVNGFRRTHCFADAFKRVMGSMACSTMIVLKDGKFWIVRCLDWPDKGKLGPLMVLTKSKGQSNDGEYEIESLTLPGFIGALNAVKKINEEIVFVGIINEQGSTRYSQGTPHNIFLANLMKKASSVDQAEKILDGLQGHEFPASSFHLILCDKYRACVFQIHAKQGDNGIIKREINGDGYLVVTNHVVSENGDILPGTGSCRSSEKRAALMEKTYLESLQKGSSIRESLIAAAQPNPIKGQFTMGAMLYSNAEPTRYAFDHGFASEYLRAKNA